MKNNLTICSVRLNWSSRRTSWLGLVACLSTILAGASVAGATDKNPDFPRLGGLQIGLSPYAEGLRDPAYQKQIARFREHKITRNAEMNTAQIEKFCVLDSESKDLLHVAINHLCFSARGYYRAIKMARTIADLDNQEGIHKKHVSEALQYLYKTKF